MKKKSISKLTVVLTFCLLLSGLISHAAVVVTPTVNGNCISVAPGPFTVLSNIIITEGLVGDFAVQSGTTFILTAPAGFEFNPGSGSVTFTAGRDITTAALSVTSSTITVTLTIPTNTKLDVLRIRNVGVRALSYNIAGQILRTGSGGTATVTGDAPGAGINHGSLNAAGTGGTITSIANGPWSSAATWFAGNIPGCTDNVVINHQVTANISPSLNNLTINSGGNLIADFDVVVSGNFTMNGTAIYTHNNSNIASTSIFKGFESFAPTSKIIINAWSSFGVPLANGVNGDFGQIEINTSGTWSQDGLLAPARIKNTLTVNNGLFILDDGTGMTTSLTLQDVVIGGTGRIQIQAGAPRNLTLATGNFSDLSSSASLSTVVFRAVGNLSWTVNGNLNINHRFSIIEGLSTADVGVVDVQVNGNFSIGGASFDGMKRVVGPFNMTVTGTTSITGSPSLVTFKNYYDGDLTFTSGSMTVNGAPAVYFLGSNGTIGAATVQINGNLTLTGANSRLYVASNASNNNIITVNVSNDFIITNAQMYTALTTGDVVINVGRNLTQTGASSEFYAQRSTSGSSTSLVNVNGSTSISDGLFNQSRNLGNTVTNVVEVLSVQNATFFGMNNTTVGNYGTSSLVCADLNITGSSFYLHKGYITDSRTVLVDVTNDFTINFTNSSQEVILVGRNSDNTAVLDLNIGGNFVSFGTANGLFCSSVSAGDETVDIGGNLVVSAGRVRFNAYENYNARGHLVTGNISGSLTLSGGSVCLSSNRGNADWTITGDYDQTGGYAIYKWYNLGYVNLNVLGNYILNSGTATFYSRAATATSDPVTVTINGTTSLANAVIVFDSCAISTASHKMVFKGASVTYGDNVIFDHAAHLSTRVYFGNLIFDRAGTITLRRNSSTFDIRQTKQYITPGTTVDFAASPFDLMISSHALSAATTHTTMYVDGTLTMGERMITGRNQPAYYAAVTVSDGARLKTAHTGGLYDGSGGNSCIYPLISGSFRMNYYLGASSTVEYNGVDNQRLTGVGLGIATTDDHRFGILDINFNGTPDVEFVYVTPTADSATIRGGIILTKGELNLDSDHDPAGGGTAIHLLNGATIARIAGYIRSETNDGSGEIRWKLAGTGTYVIPFGYNSTSYIPLTFQLVSGNPGTPSFATNRVAADNTPYPPSVTHVNNTVGIDNSLNTVDRFWKMSGGAGFIANITFSFTPSESSGIGSPRAQLWEPVSRGWFPPAPIQSNPTAVTTMVSGVNSVNTWWTMAPSSNPLPVELISFEAKAVGNHVKLDWLTASELNNDYFTVERSLTGEDFTGIERINGAGTTSSANAYSTVDYSPRNGLNYYRLMQTDFDGRKSYSDVRSVNFKKDAPIQIYPNPVIGQLINISAGESDQVISSVNIFDLAGKLIYQSRNTESQSESNKVEMNLEKQLVQGTYIVEVNTPSGVYRERIVKQ